MERNGVDAEAAFGDGDGEVRLAVFVMTWDAYVHLAFDEVRLAGRGLATGDAPAEGRANRSPIVGVPERIAVLYEQLELLASATETAMEDERDAEMALRDDREEIGAAAALHRR